MSSIIKHNRIHQEGVFQIGCVHKREESQNSELVEEALETQIAQVRSFKENAEKEAVRIIEAAKKEATTLLEKAKIDVEAMQEKQLLSQKTEQEKFEQEKDLAKAEIAEERKLMEIEIEQLRQQMLEQIEPEVVALIKKLIGRIVDKKILGKAGWLPLIVHKMLASEQVAESIRIHLSLRNYEEHKNLVEEALVSFYYPYEVVCDASLKDTVCMIEVSTGSIYYDIEEGLQEVIEEMNTLQALV